MQKAGLDEAEAGIKISGRNINNLGYADEASLWMKVKRNWRASWWRWKRKSEKADLNLNFHKRKSMASGPFTLWQTDRETMETVWDFIFLGSGITADDDCSLEIKRYLLLGRKAMTNPDSVLRSRDITLPTKVCLVKVMVFPVVMCMDVRGGQYRKLSTEELMLLNCGVAGYS